MLDVISFSIEGIVPCLQGNSRLANPMDVLARQIATIKGKPSKKRSDADYAELQRLEWYGSLYVQDGVIGWPGENVEAMLKTAAKMGRRGKDVTLGLMSMGHWALQYDGPKNVDELWEDENFRLTRLCPDKRGMGRMLKTSPRFSKWKLDFDVSFDKDFWNRSAVKELVEKAGAHVGLSSWSPKYGRFQMLRAS